MKIYNFLLLWLLLFLFGSSLRAQATHEERIDSLLATHKTGVHGAAKSPSDSLLHLIKACPTARVLMDSLIAMRDDFSGENSGAYVEAFNAAIKHYALIHQDTVVAHLAYAKAHLFKQLSQYPQALIYFNKSLNLYKEISYDEQIGMCFRNIAWIHHQQKNTDQFLAYAKAASVYFRKIPENYNTCTGTMTLAVAYYLSDSLNRSLHYFNEYYHMAERIQDAEHIAQALGKLGTFYGNSELTAGLDSARKYYEMQWRAASKDSSGRSLLTAGINMGSLEVEDKHYDQAQYYFAMALDKADHLKKPYEKQWIERTMAETYALAGQYDKAYDTFLSYAHFKDSIFSEEKNLQVTKLDKKYETAKKDQEIALLTKEKEIQRTKAQQQATVNKALIGGLLLIFMIAGLLVYTLRQRLKNQKILVTKNEEIKQAKFKQQLSELEMKALRAQMNPHFIFNCINSINRLVLSGEGEGASRYLGKFAKLIRLMLENSENPTVSLEDELVMLEAYLQLESLRFKEKIRYQIVVDDTIDRETTCLPAMVLQPFVENAIWHGLMPKEGDGLIKITIQEDEDGLKCIIEDNGVGREKALALTEGNTLKKRSLGLQITEERLKLLSKERLRELIRITDLKDSMNRALGTRVDVLIPIS